MIDGLIIDSFAGGGGASLGIAWATGKSPDIALNHDPIALAMHAKNHPDTQHVCEDAYRADLRKLVKRRRVAWLWASPDCTDFSRAKGSKPVRKHVRSLAWMVVKWAEQVKPAGIILENVREFEEWGPIVPKWKCQACEWTGTEGQTILARTRRRCPRCESLRLKKTDEFLRDPKRKGLTFRRWLGRLRNLGYATQWKVLDAADYGAPTNRKRLFLIARRDGVPITWPEPTHASPKKIHATPLFAPLKPWRSAAECIDWSLPMRSIFDRTPPLKEKTMWRIAHAVKRYVLDNPQPFLVPMTHSGERRCHTLDEPLPTITTAHRGEFAVASPVFVSMNHDNAPAPVTGPLPTVTSQHNHTCLAAASMVQVCYSEREGQKPRTLDINAPLGTVVAGGAKHALVAAFIVRHFGGMVGRPIEQPLPTTTTRGTQNQLVTASLIHFNHGCKQWSSVDEPLRTVTATGKHAALVYAFLIKYFGTAIGANVLDPLPTLTTNDRFGLVTVTIDREFYVLYDICMRMLVPREQARAQGFPDTYILHPKSKTKQTELIGNSVSPYAAAAVFGANQAGREVAT